MSRSCKAWSFATIGAILLLQGCTSSVDDEADILLVKVPATLEHPEKLVGTWKESKGAQTLVLEASGKAQLKNKAVIVAQGVNRTMDTESNCSWGVNSEKFYFHGFPNNGPSLEYDLKFEGEKLVLLQKGVKAKLAYTKTSK